MLNDHSDLPIADLPIERIQPEDARERVRVLGWVVRREESAGGDAYFPDATYSSREESYRAAKAWIETVDDVDETDTANIDRIERSPTSHPRWVLRWMVSDPGLPPSDVPTDAPSGSSKSADEAEETYPANADKSTEDAFNKVCERLREAREELVRHAEDSGSISLDVSTDRVVLRHGDEIVAEGKYEARPARQRDAKGYRVRIRRQYKVYTKYFSDRRLGGRTGALRAAQYWRDVKKGQRPEGREAPVPHELVLEEKVDNYLQAAVERSQFGVPRMSVEVRTMESGNPIPYVKASWPIKGGRSRYTYVSLKERRIEEATKEICLALVRARRSSDLSPDELGRSATPFDILDGWFASSELPLEAEAETLYKAVLPGVKERSKDVMAEWREKKGGLPGVDIRVKKNDAGQYAQFIRARWKNPSGESCERQVEIRDGDVEPALQQLAIGILQDYREHPEPSRLREDGRTPFSVLEAEMHTPEEQLRRILDVGLPDVTRTFKDLRQGLSGLRLSQKNVDSGATSPPKRGRPRKRYTLLVAWPTEQGFQRRQKSFDRESELKKTLEIVIQRALARVRESEPDDRQAAVEPGSPFAGIDPASLESGEGLGRAVRRVVRKALPSLRLELQRLDESQRG